MDGVKNHFHFYFKEKVSKFYFKAAKKDKDRALNGFVGAVITPLYFTYILMKKARGDDEIVTMLLL